MKKTYKIEVDCANCANKLEDTFTKVEGIKSCNINFMLLKMNIDFEENVDIQKKMKELEKIGKKVEPDFEVEY